MAGSNRAAWGRALGAAQGPGALLRLHLAGARNVRFRHVACFGCYQQHKKEERERGSNTARGPADKSGLAAPLDEGSNASCPFPLATTSPLPSAHCSPSSLSVYLVFLAIKPQGERMPIPCGPALSSLPCAAPLRLLLLLLLGLLRSSFLEGVPEQAGR